MQQRVLNGDILRQTNSNKRIDWFVLTVIIGITAEFFSLALVAGYASGHQGKASPCGNSRRFVKESRLTKGIGRAMYTRR